MFCFPHQTRVFVDRRGGGGGGVNGKAAGMRISASKSEAVVPEQKKVLYPLGGEEELLPPLERLKSVGVLATLTVLICTCTYVHPYGLTVCVVSVSQSFCKDYVIM